MKTLKTKSLKALIPIILFLIVIGVAFVVAAAPSMLTSFEKPIDLEEVDFSGDIEGLYVTGTIYGIYDCYCEETENGKPIGREYIIDADDYYYMGLCVDKKDFDDAEALMDASWDYLDGYSDYEELEKYQYEVTGTITRIPSDSLKYYNEYINWYDYTAEEKAMFLPYYLEVGKVGGFTAGSAIALVIAGVIFVFIGILLPILALTGFYQRSIKKYIAGSSNPDMTAEKIERFFQNTKEINGLRYNTEFICGQDGSSTAFGEVSKLAWVYLHTVTHKRYFITVSKTYSLMLGFTDGTRQSIKVKSETIAQQHMSRLGEQFPYVIFGYSNELERMFTKDLSGFLNLRFNQQQASTF